MITAGAMFLMAGLALGPKSGPNWLVGALWIDCGLAVLASTASISQADRRKEIAKAGLVAFLIAMFAGAVVRPVLDSARPAASSTFCQLNMKGLGVVAALYSADHDERFPGAPSWRSAVTPYQELAQPKWRCRDAKEAGSYAFNAAMSYLWVPALSEPNETVLFFEVEASGESPFGGPEWFVRRHRGYGFVTYADGSAKRIQDPRRVRWTK
ncbi:MAG TPA: hypothetical protein VEX38_00525 [Fimbriimonadaceae bacterium]|nr:hypothetical protein [Fimbriimonadaceae bacterium]